METDSRPFCSEQMDCSSKLQNVNLRAGFEISSGRGLDGEAGSEGCLSSDPSSSGQQILPPILPREQTFSVQGPSIRPNDCPYDFYEGYGDSGFSTSSVGGSNSSLPGRLAHSSPVQGGLSSSKGHNSFALQGVGYPSQSEEVSPFSFSISAVSGNRSLLGISKSVGVSRENVKDQILYPVVPSLKASSGKEVGSTVGIPCLNYKLDSKFKTQNEEFTNCPLPSVESDRRQSQDCLDSSMQRRSFMGLGERSSRGRSLNGAGCSRDVPMDGCFRHGLGGPSSGPNQLGKVASRPSFTFYQRSRTHGGGERFEGFSSVVGGQSGGVVLGQHDHCCLHKEAGGNCVSLPEFHSPENHSEGRAKRDHSGSPIYQGEPKCSRRHLVSSRSGDSNRVDPQSICFQPSPLSLGSSCRHVCHSHEQAMRSLLFSYARSGSVGGRCVFTELGLPHGVCLPTFQSHSKSSVQTQTLQTLSDHPHSSSLAPSNLVSRPSGSFSGFTSLPSTSEGPALPTQRKKIPRQPSMASTSRVETLIRSVSNGGFSLAAAERLARSVRPSTLRNYQARWNLFLSWCRSSDRDPASPSIPMIADFLIYLKDVKNLDPITIKGYRAMLSNTFQILLENIGSNSQLSALVRTFLLEVQKVRSSLPNWSLNKVLEYLKKAEPLENLSLRKLTCKTLFLVALATAKRVGELQALSPEISFQNANLVLHYHDWFLAKTASFFNPLESSFTLYALREMCNTPEFNNPLCPVRCLNFYLRN